MSVIGIVVGRWTRTVRRKARLRNIPILNRIPLPAWAEERIDTAAQEAAENLEKAANQ